MKTDKAMNGTAEEPAGPSPIAFRLEPGSGVPTYLQLVQQVEQALRLGYLEPGDQLPRVKDVVGSLAINPNTVLKAYRELEHRGLAGGRPGQGTFVEGTLGRVGLTQQAELRRALAAWMRTAAGAGLDPDGMAALFTAALRDFTDGGGTDSAAPGPPGPRGQPTRPSRPGRTDGPGRQGRPGEAEGVA
jgi:GntR family transcriptional regulator